MQFTSRSAAHRTVLPTLATLLLSSFTALTASAAALGPALEKRVRAATFEVIVPKPQHDLLSYERPLPLELLPFAIREDKYESIGTAFALEKNRYVTAAHVLAAAMVGSHESLLIREQSGAVHEVTDILQLSLAEDYAVFAVAGDVEGKPLVANAFPVIGEAAHAVGNAYGEGIVIRDGLLTSETPEERDGAWNWLRFSAAASPGNSGGPLLDAKGRVIGVVFAISPNENLNFALPIGRVLQPTVKSAAQLNTRQSFGLAIAPITIVTTLDKTIALPMSYRQFAPAFVKAINDFYDESLAAMISQHQDRLFPNGEKSRRLLTKGNWVSSLQIIAEQTNGEWDAIPASHIADVALPPDGELQIKLSSGVSVLKLVKPSDIALGDLFTDSKVFMDLVLKGMPLTRPVADQQVRITSLGPAVNEAWHSDRYGRQWQLRTWSFGFADLVVVVLALPKPDGADVMLQLAPTGMQHAVAAQLRFLSDYAYTGYYASLRDWQAYYALPALHPATFKSFHIEFEPGKRFSFASARFRFNLDNWLQDINELSRLDLQFSYFIEDGKVQWDITNFLLAENRFMDSYVKVTRWLKPAPTTRPEELRIWDDVVGRKGDYAGRARYENPNSSISKVISPIAPTSEGASTATDFLYVVTYQVKQFVPSDELDDLLQRATKAVELLE